MAVLRPTLYNMYKSVLSTFAWLIGTVKNVACLVTVARLGIQVYF